MTFLLSALRFLMFSAHASYSARGRNNFTQLSFSSTHPTSYLIASLHLGALPCSPSGSCAGSCPPSPASNQSPSSSSSNQGLASSSSSANAHHQLHNQQQNQQHQKNRHHGPNLKQQQQQQQRGGSSSSSKGGGSKGGSGPSSRHGSPFNGTEAEMNDANHAMNGSGAQTSTSSAAGDASTSAHIIQDIGI